MRRERKIEQRAERYLARQDRLRERRLRKKSSSLPGVLQPCHSLGADAAAVGNTEGMKSAMAAAVEHEIAPRLERRREAVRKHSNAGPPGAAPQGPCDCGSLVHAALGNNSGGCHGG